MAYKPMKMCMEPTVQTEFAGKALSPSEAKGHRGDTVSTAP